MTIIIISFACVGFLGIGIGLAAVFLSGDISGENNFIEIKKRRRNRVWALAVGIILGLASWPLTIFMGYPIETPDGIGRIVGIPFLVAYFDSAGRDYVGPLTLPAVIANAVFWCLFPQNILLFSRIMTKRRK